MKNFLLSVFCLFFVATGWTQEKDKVAWRLKLKQVDVTAQRKFQDIGITRTEIDTMVLRESVINSLADILSQSTSVFIKNYGRGTLATASFRGTAPSHTQVLWNGMKINSPMLGQVDFSLIPSYFVDDLSLWHGASSVNVTGGGLGGAVTLSNKPMAGVGMDLNFIQGISSFNTYDDFLHFRYASAKWQSSTRICYVNSQNDFKYRNYNKKDFDKDGNFISYPIERNKNCKYRDLHLLQEVYYDRKDGNRFSFAGWYVDSKRGIPMLDVNYREENEAKNQQKQNTLRVVAGWDHNREKLKIAGKVGYNFDHILYTYEGEVAEGVLAEMQHASSYVHSGFISGETEYFPSEKWMLKANISGQFHFVDSWDKITATGYEKNRTEVSALATLRYRPWKRLGLAVDVREEYYGEYTPVIPAAFLDIVLWPRYEVILKSSIAKNFHYPTLNDLYFLPGGNDTLKTEKGYTYDLGMEFTVRSGEAFSLKGEVTAYDSHIDDWIVWLPTFKGFWSPVNVKKVHSYGWELKGKAAFKWGAWKLFLDANWAQTRSINHGDPMSWADESIGKQLVYIPEYSSGVIGRLEWKGFSFLYKYNYYSERFTTSSNEKATKIGHLGSYYMNDISLEKRFKIQHTAFSLKFSVYNLFDEEYVSVLSRPMARRNYGFFIGINPRWWRSGQ
ncbi:TonB-dependent receptor [uncultured Odoribacter sp.]|uniref:TonB-dependent receptor n=1 Tax=uncultured Odoribacter sp. TaxID=876416 RepID=UPI00260AEA25|nr:TonB-dependent receptor [uncultured Odoribacter sp.]